MALTVPDFPDQSPQCLVRVGSTDAGVGVDFVLTDDQREQWSDQDLTDRIDALKTAISAVLTPGTDIQVSVAWSTGADITTLQTNNAV